MLFLYFGSTTKQFWHNFSVTIAAFGAIVARP